MSSSGTSERRRRAAQLELHLERDLPTTREDVLVQRRLHRETRMTAEQFAAFLASLDAPSHAELRARRGPRGRPFEL